MKRNFLLMLLLTLLPLVSWAAEPISSVKLSVSNVPYGTQELTQANFLASWDNDLAYGTDILWNGKYYSDEACTTEVTDLATAPVGTYWVRFDGDRYYKGSVAKPFDVTKAPLYVSVVVNQLSVTDAAPGWAGGILTTTYGVPFDVTGKKILAWKGLQNEEEFKDVVSGTLTGIVCEETDANANDQGVALGGKSAYTATLTGFTSTNYELVCVDEAWIMQKNISDGEGMTFNLEPAFTTYNGKIQDAAYTITYAGQTLVQATRNKQNEISALNDFTVSYKVATLDNDKKIKGVTGGDISDPIDANVYATQIQGQGNFTGTYPADPTVTTTSEYGKAPFVWTIKQAGLTIIALDQTKVYDGTTNLPHVYTSTNPTEAQLAENNLAVNILFPYGTSTAEANLVKQSVGITVSGAKPDVKADGYDINPTLANAGGLPNYEVNLVSGKFYITKRNLTITASDAMKLYTTSSDPTFSIANPDGFEFELSVEERNAADGGDALLQTLRTDIGTDENGAASTFFRKNGNNVENPGAKLRVVKKNDTPTTVGVHEGVLEVKYENYGKINNYNVTTKAGNFTISGGKIFITALQQRKNYGADDPDWTPVKGKNYRIDGLIGADKEKDVTGLTLTREKGEEVGSYRITPSGAVAPAGYEDIVYADGEFVIDPRPITVTVLNQTMKDGDKASTLDKTAYTIDNTDPNEGLVAGEDASEIFTLALCELGNQGSPATYNFTSYNAAKNGDVYAENGVVAFLGYDETDGFSELNVVNNGTGPAEFNGRTFYVEYNPANGIPVDRLQLYEFDEKGTFGPIEVWVKITKGDDAVDGSDAVTVVDGKVILNPNDPSTSLGFNKYENGIIVVAVDADKYANYKFTVDNGSLYVINKNALVLDDKDENLDQNISDRDGDKRVFVAFGSRVLKAKQWNTLVLPFATSVGELSNAFDYAVVDMLDETNAKPEVVSIGLAFGNIPANTPFLIQPKDNIDLADGYFFTKTIVYSENPEAVDQAGHRLIGTYKGHLVTPEDKSEMYYSPTVNSFVTAGNPAGVAVNPMRAYLKDDNAGTPNEVRYISIQDPDGEENITAIGEVTVDTDTEAEVNAEGWYNVQGMKLNAAPTQKGIYIKDGKKVLVK